MRMAHCMAGNSFRIPAGRGRLQTRIGKKTSFMCSHVDSLTGENRATTGFCPDHS